MKYIVFGDIHDRGSLDLVPRSEEFSYLCLGDIVAGDLRAAKKSIDAVRELNAVCVYGNHDKSVVDDGALNRWRYLEEKSREEGWGREETFRKFYNDALKLRKKLGNEYKDFLASLNEMETIESDGKKIKMVHDGLPSERGEKLGVEVAQRITDINTARANFENPLFDWDILLVGHSHAPLFYRQHGENIYEKIFQNDGMVKLTNDRYILNPGSLENIRKQKTVNSLLVPERINFRSYGILDTESSTFEVKFFR